MNNTLEHAICQDWPPEWRPDIARAIKDLEQLDASQLDGTKICPGLTIGDGEKFIAKLIEDLKYGTDNAAGEATVWLFNQISHHIQQQKYSA